MPDEPVQGSDLFSNQHNAKIGSDGYLHIFNNNATVLSNDIGCNLNLALVLNVVDIVYPFCIIEGSCESFND